MNSLALKMFASLLLLFVGLYGGFTLVRMYLTLERQESEVVVLRPAKPIDQLTFTDSSGKPFPVRDMQGKVWVASFFFATCPGFCTQMNQTISGLQKEFADRDVTFVSFSVDPTNDTPGSLAEYAKKFNADPEKWKFVVGKFEDTQDLGQGAFQITVQGRDHTDRLVLLDREGNIRGRYSYQDSTQLERFKKDLLALTEQPAKTVAKEPAAASK